MGRAMNRMMVASMAAASLLTTVVPAAAEEARSKPVRGILRAEASAVVSSELVARVATMPLKAGQSFKAGDVLLTFDCRRYAADLRAAEAEVKTQEITVDANRQLLRHRAAGANELALAEAKLAQAVATTDSLRVKTSQCTISAPYDGRLVERVVDVFEMPQPNTPLLKIVKDGQLEVDLMLPSDWAVGLKSGDTFSFFVDETKTSHAAQILFLGAVIDPVSRTIKATGRLTEAASDLRPGMSGAGLLSLPATAVRN